MSSELESTPGSCAEPSHSRSARKRQRLVQVSENQNVCSIQKSPGFCEVDGCRSACFYPPRGDGLLTCKAHKKCCAESGCSQGIVDYSYLCERHVLARALANVPETMKIESIACSLLDLQTFKRTCRLGEGSFGVVFLSEYAYDSCQLFAVKQVSRKAILESPNRPRIFRKLMFVSNEMEALAAIDCPRVVRLYSVFQDSVNIYFVLEYCAGGSLAGYMVARGRFSDAELATVIYQVSEGLIFIHDAGFIHRDIKPGNILIDSEGHLKITDFNLSCGMGDTCDVGWGGTHAYSPPEVFSRRPRFNELCDVWSLGVVTFECFLGRRLFPNDDLEEVTRRIVSHEVAAEAELYFIQNTFFKSCLLTMFCDATMRAYPAQVIVSKFIKEEMQRWPRAGQPLPLRSKYFSVPSEPVTPFIVHPAAKIDALSGIKKICSRIFQDNRSAH